MCLSIAALEAEACWQKQKHAICDMIAGELQPLSTISECTDKALIEKVGHVFPWRKLNLWSSLSGIKCVGRGRQQAINEIK